MQILVTNDDRYLEPGIRILADARSVINNMTLVAPDCKSGLSKSFMLMRPLQVQKKTKDNDRVDVTPTDYVYLAIPGGLVNKSDVALSGINKGFNLVGDDILVSCTFAAATEGPYLGLTPLAVSLRGKKEKNYCASAQKTTRVVEIRVNQQIANELMRNDLIFNIKVTDSIFNCQSVKTTRLGVQHKTEPMERLTGPYSPSKYAVFQPEEAQDAEAGTNFYANEKNQVPVTPLLVNLAQHESINSLQRWLGNLT
jgi:5'-nucleotidase